MCVFWSCLILYHKMVPSFYLFLSSEKNFTLASYNHRYHYSNKTYVLVLQRIFLIHLSHIECVTLFLINRHLKCNYFTLSLSKLSSHPTTPSGLQPLARFTRQRPSGFRRIGHREKEGLCEQAPITFLFPMPCPDSMLQHILNKDPIPSRTILYKHMRHRPD